MSLYLHNLCGGDVQSVLMFFSLQRVWLVVSMLIREYLPAFGHMKIIGLEKDVRRI